MNRLQAALLTLLIAATSAFGAAGTEQIREVRLETRGDGVVDRESVQAYTSVKVGDPYDPDAISRDVRALQQSGRFSKIDVVVDPTPGNVVVTYIVESKPRIRRLEVTGADYVGNRKVRDLLELGVGDMVDDATIGAHLQKVQDHYRKKYFPYTRFTWTLVPASQAGTMNVTIRVKEGKRATVRSIRFDGNRNIPSRVLRKVMKQRRVNWLSIFTGAGTYSPEDLASDVDTLRSAYLDRGYLDVQIGEPEVQEYASGRKLRVRISIQEGVVYKIGQVGLEGVTLFGKADVARAITIKSGDVASMGAVQKSLQGLRDYYGGRGYIRTVVQDEVNVNADARTADVAFRITEGKLAYIRNIYIRGNSVTKDKVIRRELAVYPGDVYSETRIRTSEGRLRNLGFFSYVNSMPEDTRETSQYDLVFEVEEQKTGSFMVGVGFSSVDDLIGFVELSQGNFDITDWPRFSGGGQKLRMRAQVGTQRDDYEIEFIEPWFLNRRLSLGVELFQHESRFLSEDYDQKNIGGSIKLGRPLGYGVRANLIYTLEEISVENVATNASEQIRVEEGKRTKSSLTLELVRDTRNSVFLPSRGNRTSVSGTVAGGLLGGETDISVLQVRTSQYVPLWLDHVLNLRGWAGVVEPYGNTDRVPIFDRFFLGGARTIRGFKYRDVGPKDENGEPIGGNSASYASAEYTMPVVEKVRLAVFYDAGMVWRESYSLDYGDLNTAAGCGLRFDFPGFPIQLDYAWPLEHDEFNDRPSGRFSFWLGYAY